MQYVHPSVCRFIAHKWIIYVASVLVTIVDGGVVYAQGAMFVPLLDKFRESRSATALVQSLMIGMFGLGTFYSLPSLC